ncbi:fibronectin type III domain-containing protein, partial [candidate division WWE3 bacterium]|nr:fibronectin type III domain-containing protein [candidate division WWE3 bacterium]
MSRFRLLPLKLLVVLGLLICTTPASIHAQEVSINNVQIKNVGYTSATIAWFTNVAANSQVSYGKDTLFENTSPSSNTYTDSHSITLTNLKPATQYQFQVTSTTKEGITASSQEMTFSTLSFTFEDSIGNFSTLNATPTPTPVHSNPSVYGQTTYPNTAGQYVQGTTYGTQQPVYIIPPVIYQQPQTNGNTLGAQDIVSPTPIIIQSNQSNDILGLFQSSMIGMAVLVIIVIFSMAGFFYVFFKNKHDIDILKMQITPDNGNPQKNTTQ